jgi:pyruvate kinase
MRRTKIICTMGPAVDEDDVLIQLMQRGMNVARLNFSHGTHDEHLTRVKRIKRLREQLGLPIALLLDTKGPEIRTGNFINGRVQLEEGATVTVAASSDLGSETFIPVSYATSIRTCGPVTGS